MRTKSSLALLATMLCLGALACDRPQPERPQAAPPPPGPTTVIVVRHAEKAAGDDPELTEAGRQRAHALAAALEDSKVAAIYSSPFKRTMNTARPLSELTGIPITEAPINLSDPGTYPKQLADRVLAENPGKTVVVVNHSNTVPAIVEALSGRPVPPIDDADYDNLFVVTIVPGGETRLVRANFGAASSAAAAGAPPDNSMGTPAMGRPRQ
jgi:broad specificity phosphatase PhoE